MKDLEVLKLKAFLAALTQQDSALDTATQTQLQRIGQNLTSSITQLHLLAKGHPTLLVSYGDALTWLGRTSSERSKGLDFLPDDEQEIELYTDEISNVSGDIRNLYNLYDVLEKLEQKNERQLLTDGISILTASDSVKAAKDVILISFN